MVVFFLLLVYRQDQAQLGWPQKGPGTVGASRAMDKVWALRGGGAEMWWHSTASASLPRLSNMCPRGHSSSSM